MSDPPPGRRVWSLIICYGAVTAGLLSPALYLPQLSSFVIKTRSQVLLQLISSSTSDSSPGLYSVNALPVDVMCYCWYFFYLRNKTKKRCVENKSSGKYLSLFKDWTKDWLLNSSSFWCKIETWNETDKRISNLWTINCSDLFTFITEIHLRLSMIPTNRLQIQNLASHPIDIGHCNWKIALLHFNGPRISNGYIRYFYRFRMAVRPQSLCSGHTSWHQEVFRADLCLNLGIDASQIEADMGWIALLGAPLWISSENINSIYLWGTIFNLKSHRIDVTCRSMLVNLWISPRFIGVTHGWTRPRCSLYDIYFRYFMKITPYFIMTFIGRSVGLLMVRMMLLSLNALSDKYL